MGWQLRSLPAAPLSPAALFTTYNHASGGRSGHGTVDFMEENPYAKHLEGREAVAILTATPARLRELLTPLSAEDLDRTPGPNKWSLRELMAHLADCELAFGFRLRQALPPIGEGIGAPELPTIQPFDQDVWATRYANYGFATSLATYEALRTWNLQLLETVRPEDRAQALQHPERGTITFQTIVETIAGHDTHHLRLLESLLKREGAQAVPSPS